MNLRAAILVCALGWGSFSCTPREIHSVKELRSLSFDALHSQVKVRMRGYITISNASWNVMVFEDESGDGARLEAADFTAPTNQLIEVTGFAAAGGNTPTIARPRVRWLSKQNPPAPRQVELDRILDPALQCTQVIVKGVVRASTGSAGVMQVGNTVVHVQVVDSSLDTASLVDEDLGMKGVVETSFDLFGQPTSAVLWIARGADIIPLTSAPPLAALPIQSIASIEQNSSKTLPRHRIRVNGEVFADPSGTKIFVKDKTGELQAILAPNVPLRVGEGVDAIGFLTRRENSFVLDEAVLTRVVEHRPSNHLRELTTTAQIHALPAEEAAREYPVHVHGVVTYFDPVYSILFIQDATGGTFVEPDGLKGSVPKSGQIADIWGTTEDGIFAPEIGHVTVRPGQMGRLPQPYSGSDEDLYTGKLDSDLVRAQGVVQSIRHEVGHSYLGLESGVHHFEIEMVGDAPWSEALMNSMVSVEGVAATNFNSRRQLTGIFIFVPSREYIRVTWRPPDPNSLRVTPIAELFQYSPSSNPDSAVKIRGVVTYPTRQGPTYIQDATGAVVIANHKPLTLRTGDVVNVLGFARLIDDSPVIQDGKLTHAGSVAPPPPVHIGADEASEADFESRLVEIDATLLDRVINQTGEILMLQSGRVLFNATAEPGVQLPQLESGAILRVTGICRLHSEIVRGAPAPRSVTLLLRTPADIAVLRHGPWWNLRHALELVGILAGLALLAFIWSLVLGNRVMQQTKVISEKLAQEENLKLAAEAASQAKSDFLAVMSHEIRTPLHGVLGMASLLRHTLLDNEQQEFVSTIQSSGQALIEIINDILDFSKIEAGKLELESVEFDLRQLVKQSVECLEVRAKDKNLALRAHVDDELSEKLIGDPARIRQILLNLLSNAVKFTQRGSVTLRAQVEATAAKSQTIRISVTDTGIGISDSQKIRLFESFSQADSSTTRKFGGTGLGLAISKRLIQQMGGEIAVESEPGVGSTFWFRVMLPSIQSTIPAAESKHQELEVPV